MPLPATLASAKKSSSLREDGHKEMLANRYQVQRQLGSGNCGTALMVIDLKEKIEREKKKVVKKIFVGNLLPDETVDAEHEASLLRNLNCPGIVKFYDSFVDKEFFCIITEFCEGGDLDGRIEEYKKKNLFFPEQLIVEWIIELLLALKYMHSRKILHRDLKSRNIFLRNERVKIGDFGISRILMGSSDMASTFVGTPYYMSPEVLKHEGYNSKSDIWSLGCILYDLVALEHPFQGSSLMGVMYQITDGPPPSWPEQYSSDLEQLFHSTLEKDPSKRPSAIDALRFPFVVRQFELMKSTLMEKQLAREQNDLIAKDAKQIASEFNRRTKYGDLQQEAEYKRERNLPPRERMRIKKEREADEAGRRIQVATLQQKKENEARRQEISRKNNPYESTLQIGGRSYRKEEDNGSPKKRNSTYPGLRRDTQSSTDNDYDENDYDEEDEDDSAFKSAIRRQGTRPPPEPTRAPPLARRVSADDERPISPMKGGRHNQDYDRDDETGTQRSSRGSGGRLKTGGDLSRTMGELRRVDEPLPGGRHPLRSLRGDDRPITPMRNKMVYDVNNSSLDFKDGIPDRADMADTYYEQFNDFNEDDDDEEEIIHMVSNLQTVLDNNSTLTDQQVVSDDKQAGAFGPGARDIKIKNLRIEAEKKLGKNKFEKVYKYLKKARYEEKPRGKEIDEKKIMADLHKITPSRDDCYLVETLLFLEIQQRDSQHK